MSSNKLFWGGLLILGGVILLLFNLNFLGSGFIQALSVLWPVLIIAFGISVSFKRILSIRFGAWLIAILVLVYFGLNSSQYDFISKANQATWFHFPERIEISETKISELPSQSGNEGQFELNLASGEVIIDANDDVESIVEIPVDYAKVTQVANEHTDQIIVEQLGNNSNSSFGISHIYSASLATNKPWSLAINAAALDANIDLSELTLNQLDINAAAGDVYIQIGQILTKSEINLNAAASSVEIDIPKEIGVKIESNSLFHDIALNGNFTKNDGNYTSDNFESADYKLLINLGSAIGEIQVDHE